MIGCDKYECILRLTIINTSPIYYYIIYIRFLLYFKRTNGIKNFDIVQYNLYDAKAKNTIPVNSYYYYFLVVLFNSVSVKSLGSADGIIPCQ